MIARRLIVALFIAVLVSGAFTYWLSRRLAGARSASGLHYVTAIKDLEAGEVLRPELLSRTDWPKDKPIEGAVTRLDDVVGRALLYPASKGQPMLQRQVSAAGTMAGLSAKIPDGMRAISLKSDQVVGVAGFLSPGTRIDVLVTYHPPGSQEPLTSTVLQDARLLAAGQQTQPDPEGKPVTVSVVTLLVTPFDAEKVVLASTQGTVHFVLRNGADHNHVDGDPAQLSAFGKVAAEKPVIRTVVAQRVSVPITVKPYTVETFRGDKHSVETF
jgi:pilus assembly protein CpaB